MNIIIDKNSRALVCETGDLKLRVSEQEEGVLTVEKLGKTDGTEADGITYLSDGKN